MVPDVLSGLGVLLPGHQPSLRHGLQTGHRRGQVDHQLPAGEGLVRREVSAGGGKSGPAPAAPAWRHQGSGHAPRLRQKGARQGFGARLGKIIFSKVFREGVYKCKIGLLVFFLIIFCHFKN